LIWRRLRRTNPAECESADGFAWEPPCSSAEILSKQDEESRPGRPGPVPASRQPSPLYCEGARPDVQREKPGFQKKPDFPRTDHLIPAGGGMGAGATGAATAGTGFASSGMLARVGCVFFHATTSCCTTSTAL